VRSRGWRRVSESKKRAESPARSTATFTVVVDDLAEALELSNDVFFSASRRRGTVDERERRGRQMRERGGFQRCHRAIY
jgi:hypothetical protein